MFNSDNLGMDIMIVLTVSVVIVYLVVLGFSLLLLLE